MPLQVPHGPSLASYRFLLRAIRQTFAGDGFALTAGRNEARQHFEKNRQENEEERVVALVKDAREAAHMLQEAVVQAKRNERGNYGECFPQAAPRGLSNETAVSKFLDSFFPALRG